MPDLSSTQYFSVYNLLSLAIASMMATFVFFALVRTEVSMKYRGAVTAGAMVVFIAAYHYFRIFNNWRRPTTSTRPVATRPRASLSTVLTDTSIGCSLCHCWSSS